MDQYMLVNGKIKNHMGSVDYIPLTHAIMSELLRGVLHLEKGDLFIPNVRIMKEKLKIIKHVDMGYLRMKLKVMNI